MQQTGKLGSRLMMVLLVALLGLAGACGDDDNSEDASGSESNVSSNDGDSQANVGDDAPDPISVSADDLDIIDEWQEAGVPRFREGEVLDFEPHASRVENGGTLLLDGLNESPEEIIGFYRGALRALGWEERRVGESEMTAENDVASLLVTVNVYDDQTLIMMILTDRLNQS